MIQFIILVIALTIVPLVISEHRYQIEKENNYKPNILGANEFFYKKTRLIREGYATEGVYIFTNHSNNDCKYVGQSVDILNRVDTHLKGRGNIDVYNDIREGDQFTIELIKLKDSTFSSLDNLEKYLISSNNSYYNGYNKTRGNG